MVLKSPLLPPSGCCQLEMMGPDTDQYLGHGLQKNKDKESEI